MAGSNYTESEIRTASGVRIHFGRWPGPGSHVLCLHGLTANHLCFRDLAELLQRGADVDVAAPDLRGRGKSDKPPSEYGWRTHVADVRTLVKEAGLAPFVLIGHSLGAGIAIRYAAMYPEDVSALIVLDGGGILKLGEKIRILKALQPSLMRLDAVFPDEDAYIQKLRSSPFLGKWTPLVEAFFRYEIEKAPGGGVRCNIPGYVVESELDSIGGAVHLPEFLRKLILNPVRTFTRARDAAALPYENVKCPVLVMRATEQNVVPGDNLLPERAMQAMLKRFRNARGMSIAGVNHYGIIGEEHEERDRAILEFLKSLPGPGKIG